MPMIMQGSWHHQGLFMGMHWAWWLFWVATFLALAWAFWRLHVDRVESHRDAERFLRAEETLRDRFARGEIEEDELVERMATLRRNRGPGTG